ncbi:hypothetical protein [Capnocytophaga gingivalis]|uniref:hypothetical protein n=1 Tax=Capnocytophaga gingivalis TaxID=1017 RepID=UPI0028D41A5F|nr:hypothetical protein [Capnocytophaga gingivalis]
MKRTIYALCTAICALFTVVSCSRSEDPRHFNIPQEAREIISDRLLEEMESNGMQINEGDNPPDIQGIFQTGSYKSIYTNVKGDMIGETYLPYRYKFYEQNGIKIKTDYIAEGNRRFDIATGEGTIISGSGNKFTVYMKVKGNNDGALYKEAKVFSGEITPEGIRNIQMGLCIVEKDDPKGELIPVGGIRVFNNESSLAVRKQNYPRD